MNPKRAALSWTCLVALATASAQEPKEVENASSWLPILRQQAADYEIVPRGVPGQAPRRLPEPILRWTQPVRGGDDGAVFLWVLGGRPEAVATIFTYRGQGPRYIQHELHSLAPTPLDARWRGKPAWNPERPGVDFRLVPDAPEPAASAPARLRQMQAIARDVSASSLHDQAGRNELRLMPRPLYRYEPTDPDLVDGVLLCFAHGTDPEVFLLVEARRQAGMPAAYHYGFARFSDLQLAARYKGQPAWDVPAGTMNVRDRPHAYFAVEELDAETPDDYRRLTARPKD